MNLNLPPLDALGILFLSTSIVFGFATLYALWAILRAAVSPSDRGDTKRAWWASRDAQSEGPGLRAVFEELVWLAVPLLLLLWLWRSI